MDDTRLGMFGLIAAAHSLGHEMPRMQSTGVPDIGDRCAYVGHAGDSKRPKRNAPCPCGSGVKFKKCCWARQFTVDMASGPHKIKTTDGGEQW